MLRRREKLYVLALAAFRTAVNWHFGAREAGRRGRGG